MRTAAILLGILGALLILAFGLFLYAIGFGQMEKRIPSFWSYILLAFSLGLAGGIATWWRATLGIALMALSALIWFLLQWQMMQTLNLFDSGRGTVTTLVIALLPPSLLGLAIYLALKRHYTSRLPYR